jgi:copper chaperone CopZ
MSAPVLTYTVTGMSCQHCVNAISGEVSGVPGVTDVAVDLSAGTVTVTGSDLDDAAIRAAIDEAGYDIAE